MYTFDHVWKRENQKLILNLCIHSVFKLLEMYAVHHHSTLEKEQFKKSLKVRNYHGIHVQWVSQTTPPCLHSLLYLFCELFIVLDGWAQVFIYTSASCISTVTPVSFSFTHMFSVLLLQIFIPPFFSVNLHLIRFFSTHSLLSLHIKNFLFG